MNKLKNSAKFQVDILFPGFSGKLTNGGLGWGSVALIRDGKHNILLDTGGPVIRGTLKKMLLDYGLKPEDIDIILITHLHFDHAYNVDMFPQAKFVFSLIEWEHVNNVQSLDCFAAENAIPLLRHLHKHLIIDEGEEIIPGITAIFTPGHTPGSVSYILHQDQEKWIMVGDAAKNRGEIRSREVQMTLNQIDSNESLRKIIKMADRILPGHDGWITVKEGHIIAEGGNDVILIFGQGVTVNGGLTSIAIHMD